MRTVTVSFVLACVCASLPGCGDDGQPYYGGGAYGGPCRNDYDCAGAYCAEVQGGVCLSPCRSDYDCGPSYVCRSVNRHGTPGHIDVCVWR